MKEFTKDYSKFKMINFNRGINREHINKLKKLITENGYLSAYPILVDENFNIIDGQHRFIACKEMGIPFYYSITKIFDNNLLVDLNTSQKKWAIDDFIKFYSMQGKVCYVKLMKFAKDFGLKYGTAAAIITNSINGGCFSEKLKSGNFSFNDNQYAVAQARAEKMLTVIELMRLPKADRLVRALLLANRESNFSFDTFIAKLARQQDKVYKCATTAGYCTMVENIYNNNNKNKIALIR